MPGRRWGRLLGGVVLIAVVLVVVTRETAPRTGAEPPPVSTVESAPPPVVSASAVAPVPPSSPPVPPPPAPVPVQDLVDAAERAKPPGMTLGVAVLDVDTGDLAEGRNGARRFMSASLSKLLVVVDMFDRRSTEGRAIAEPDLELVGRALSSSDDGAMNVLWGRYDGQGAIGRVAARLGLSATRAPADSKLWGDTMVTAADFARIYRHILLDMAVEDRDVIVGALAATAPTATDGFDQQFGLLARGASEEHYAKQGWVPYRPSGYLLHSAGVVHDGRTDHAYAIALLSTQSSVGGQAARDRLSTVATAVMDSLA